MTSNSSTGSFLGPAAALDPAATEAAVEDDDMEGAGGRCEEQADLARKAREGARGSSETMDEGDRERSSRTRKISDPTAMQMTRVAVKIEKTRPNYDNLDRLGRPVVFFFHRIRPCLDKKKI
jgi:hypothetical protein